MRGLLILLVLFSLGGLPGSSVRAAEVVPWLYEVAMPVASQSEAERSRASSEALLLLLTRLTGLAYVPRTPEVVAAVESVDRYYNEFRFAVGADDGLALIVQFDPNPVQELIRAAGLPIWRATRERVLVWTVIQEETDRTLLGATSPSPLVPGFEAQALARGLPLTIPLLDLEDQLAVDPAAVWGRLSQVVDPASRRYGADVLLLGRISRATNGLWQGDWEFWLDGVVVPFVTEGDDLSIHATQAVDVLADELAARRVVHGREADQLRIAVAGIDSPSAYGRLLDYLNSLEFVEKVGVTRISRGRLWLTVDTPADPARLLAAFERDRRLFDDQLAQVDSADLRVVWRNGD